jgi:membrane-bound ClpP family serine protease
MIGLGGRVVVTDERWSGEAGVVVDLKPGGRVRVTLDSGPVVVVPIALVTEEP